MMIARHNFLKGLGSLIVAPSIVRVESLMPIKVIDNAYYRYLINYSISTDSMVLIMDKALFPLSIPNSCLAGVLTETEVKSKFPNTLKRFKNVEVSEGAQKCAIVHLATSEEWLAQTGKWQRA